MIKGWQLTPQAEQSLMEIAQWTFDTFGPRQADAYELDILDRLDAITDGVLTAKAAKCYLMSK